MRWLCLLTIVMFVPGCAMPAAFTIASFALDTGSYAMSGKTLTDHGLSLAMEEDCSMMRVLDEDDEVCREKRDYEVADAVLTPLAEDSNGVDARGSSRGGVAYAQLAERVHKARTVHASYLAAGMMEAET